MRSVIHRIHRIDKYNDTDDEVPLRVGISNSNNRVLVYFLHQEMAQFLLVSQPNRWFHNTITQGDEGAALQHPVCVPAMFVLTIRHGWFSVMVAVAWVLSCVTLMMHCMLVFIVEMTWR